MGIYTEAKVSPTGKVNKEDIRKWLIQTAIFFAAPTIIYLGQLQGTLNHNQIITLQEFVPNLITIGGIEGWLIGVLINFFLKLSNGKN